MYGDEPADHLAEHAGRHGLATEVGPGPAVGGQGPGSEQAALIQLRARLLSARERRPTMRVARCRPEATLDETPGRTGALQPAVGAGPGEQRQPGHEHGLARARLPGDHGEGGGELQARLLDDPEAGDTHLLEHGGDCRSRRGGLGA